MAQINGTDAANTITGTNDVDVIRGLGGNDFIKGLDGNDIIYGDGQLQRVVGTFDSYYTATFAAPATLASNGTAAAAYIPGLFEAYGDDYVEGGNGADTVYGGDGNDAIRGDRGSDTLYGGNGNDAFRGGEDRDIIDGGAGIDDVRYEDAAYAVEINLGVGLAAGGAGIDTLYSIENAIGSNYDDAIFGSSLANSLRGAAGNDQIFGDAGNDGLDGQAGADQLYGGDGNDLLYETDGGNRMDGGAGTDQARFGGSSNQLTVDLATGVATISGYAANTLVGIEDVSGANNSNYILGDGAANRLFGNAFNDFFDGRGGTDSLYGGAGNDTLYGNDGNDAIFGGAGNDGLYGQGGNDFMTGEAGDDTVIDGVGTNSLYGGDGNDYISGTGTVSGDAGDDTIYSFSAQTIYGGSGHDQLHLGAGAQRVDYDTKGDDDASAVSPLYAHETVFDFSGAGGDRIDVSGIDAKENVAGNQAFTFVAQGTVNQAGEIGLLVQGGVRFLVAQTDNVAGNDLVLEIANNAVINDGFIIN